MSCNNMITPQYEDTNKTRLACGHAFESEFPTPIARFDVTSTCFHAVCIYIYIYIYNVSSGSITHTTY